MDNPFHNFTYRVGNSTVLPYPFPHLFVDNLFPESFYDELRSHFPSSDYLKPISSTGKVNYSPNRRVLLFDEIETLPLPLYLFWKKFQCEVLSPHFTTIVSSLLKIVEPITPKAQFVMDGDGYSIGPHTDHPIKAATFLFYFPEEASQKAIGTSLFIPRHRTFESEGLVHYPFEHFHEIVRVPYLPNSLFAFRRTNNSFHGVPSIETPFPRRSIALWFERDLCRKEPEDKASEKCPAQKSDGD